jgi:hypothetical protein
MPDALRHAARLARTPFRSLGWPSVAVAPHAAAPPAAAPLADAAVAAARVAIARVAIARVAAALFVAALTVLGAAPGRASAQDLILNGTTMTLGGLHRFDTVRLTNNARLVVRPYNGVDKVNTGNLVIVANRIEIDATSTVDARGAGYRSVLCLNGEGPTPTAGGRGGCAVRDSGGGGAHFGIGGRGTIDAPTSFPAGFEEDCGAALNGAGTACASYTNCRNGDGLPTVAGLPYYHSIWEVEFGAAGGDKGCRDGDGFVTPPGATGGSGGGRVVLAAINDARTGVADIRGTVTANGRRGCGIQNDSAGGGAGGTVLIVGDDVRIGATARITAAGGRGGDTFAGAPSSPDSADCPPGSQSSGVCDDCGGGGGGGIITVMSRSRTLDPNAIFDVSGAPGGVCPICTGEAGGGAGELQLNQLYVGEECDGYDNDFDGLIDEGFADATCGLGVCAVSGPSCVSGRPAMCMPTTTAPSCFAPAADARPRVAVILDTSASMLQDLRGFPTFGDGSADKPGIDTDGDGQPNDSRLFLAREALANVMSAYPEIDFALARYHQEQAENLSCQTAAWIECAGIFASYDDPRDNTGPLVCNVPIGPAPARPTIAVRRISTGDECINYAGNCGPPRRGADILAGFGMPTRDIVRWLDGRETRFSTVTTPGNVCDHANGGDCEVRGSGGTPLAGSLQAVEDYVVPIRSTDAAAACRSYSIILVTDGVESCGGDPVAQARRLHDTFGLQVYVVAVSVLPSEEAALNQLARAGSGGTRDATFVRRPEELVPALTSIIAGSIRVERCNGVDDDCDGLVDEGFPGLGDACDDGRIGICRGTGTVRCTADTLGVECRITTPGMPPGVEVCNGLDDDCNGRVDEGLVCTGSCTPTGPEICNGVDDDCNGAVDEADPALGTPCGTDEGECSPGVNVCIRGMIQCAGAIGPRDEVCNGLDDDCDGMTDDLAVCPAMTACIEGACRRACDPLMEFNCPFGFECLPRPPSGDTFCIPTPCAACRPDEVCRGDRCVDPCEGVTCVDGERCVRGSCQTCASLGCAEGELCIDLRCRPDACAGLTCGAGEGCFRGTCRRACDDRECPPGSRCGATSGACETDPCAATTCDAGRVCVDGACVPDMCAAIDCPAGTTCYPGRGCVGDPCVGVRCPVDRVCEVVERGEAQCRYRDPSAIPRGATFVRAEGGGGFCAVSAAGPGGGGRDAAAGLAAAGAIAVAAGALRRRRRRAGRRAGRSGGVSEPSRGSRGGAR